MIPLDGAKVNASWTPPGAPKHTWINGLRSGAGRADRPGHRAGQPACFFRRTIRETDVRILLTEQQIQEGVHRLAEKVNDAYHDRPVTVLAVLTGSIVLLADLIRRLTMPLRVGVVQASSYRGKVTTPGPLTINPELMPDIRDRSVLLVDDIFDTGRTLAALAERLRQWEPTSLQSAVLLRKQGRQEVEYQPDFCAFTIPNVFVVGYGLDYDDQYRNLPYLAAVEESDL
jgi:hypoxanthine phosphoribosyltransferase